MTQEESTRDMSYLAGALAAALSRAAECELPCPVPDALGARRPRELAVLPRQLRSGRSESAGSSGDLVYSPEVGRVAAARPCASVSHPCKRLLQISQICRDRVPRSRFRRSRVDHCGCAWHFWIMSLGVLAPPGDGFHGPVPHGAQGLALCVWFKLCYNPVRIGSIRD